ncbi:MAG: carbonate dehydratase [Chitinophagaceae bacterium]|nr:carbonate dehydratase [Hydrotalea sp.]MCU0323190.1 carbonate dehydratase [Chitinophagaceae bacterium]
MKSYEKILLENKAWARESLLNDPEFFLKMLDTQKPEFLWIGCSDSRVPAETITGMHPGEIFVHRNIANLVVHNDFNLLSVLDYAVEVLHVKHIIVCGHYGCGGVKAALNHHNMGIINKWLRHIKDVYRIHQDELEQITDEETKVNQLVEFNVREQVMNLAKTSIVQKAWKYEQRPHLHGWVYSLSNGILKSIFDMPPGTEIDTIYQYDDL